METNNLPAKIEQVLVGGDLSKLSTEERVSYYQKLCESLGLNPLTKPFEYITLNGKLQLYARKDATEQLRKLYGVSIGKVDSVQVGEGIIAFKAHAVDGTGRTDEAIGAVSVVGLKGDVLANAVMKAETKAKRRVTLSICGLGMLDETELETIPAKAQAPVITVSNAPTEQMSTLAETKFFSLPERNPAQETFLSKRGCYRDEVTGQWICPKGTQMPTKALIKLSEYETEDLQIADELPDWDASTTPPVELSKWKDNETLAELNTRISDLAEKKKMPSA